MLKDPGSRKLYYPDGKPLAMGAIHKNPDLAALLEALAQANSAEPFYRGDIAQRIAEAFAKNGGIVTVKDLAAYQPKLGEPLTLRKFTPQSKPARSCRIKSPPKNRAAP